MSLLASWLLFPLVLATLCLGCGLLLERGTGTRLPGPLLPGVGMAVVVVVGQLLTQADALAELATPAVVALAVAGLGLGVRRPSWRSVRWAAVTALAVYAVFAAPIVLSGEASFAGYIKLDDTATWLALTDHVIEHGRNLDGLAPSTYEATLDFNLGAGYPVGVFLPLGVGQLLVGQDPAWLIQPYMAFLAVVLGLALWSLAAPLVASPRLRALAAALAAQSTLLFGYYLWGGVKELAAAALIATACFLAAQLAVPRERARVVRAAMPLAVVSAALLAVLSAGGAIWLLPPLALALAAAARRAGGAEALRRAVAVAALTAILAAPVIAAGGLLPPTSSPLTSGAAQGNLIAPLEPWQAAGIWLSGDFRLPPSDPVSTYLLIAVAVVAALAGLAVVWRARALAPFAYVAGALVACAGIYAFGSPWVDGKALATASPAIPFAACVFGAALWSMGRRIEGGVLLSALAVGVLWSNALAYRDVSLAPRGQLAELEEIGERIAGEGPTLMTEYQPYGARHFLRESDPEGLSELRRRPIPLRSGNEAPPQSYHDVDEVGLRSLLVYRTVVLRRNPAGSRPPAAYERAWRGRYYEAWQRPAYRGAVVLDHLPLGSAVDPAAVPDCEDVLRLADAAGTGGTLVAAPAARTVAVRLETAGHPPSWESARAPGALVPDGAGAIRAAVEVPASGGWEIWLGGSVRPAVRVEVDGRPVGSVRHQLNNRGQYVLLGTTHLDPGLHEVTIRFEDADLHPGSGGAPFPIGPLVLSRPATAPLAAVPVARASRLCGRRWDWLEATSAG